MEEMTTLTAEKAKDFISYVNDQGTKNILIIRTRVSDTGWTSFFKVYYLSDDHVFDFTEIFKGYSEYRGEIAVSGCGYNKYDYVVELISKVLDVNSEQLERDIKSIGL
jgi:hypothetical protein